MRQRKLVSVFLLCIAFVLGTLLAGCQSSATPAPSTAATATTATTSASAQVSESSAPAATLSPIDAEIAKGNAALTMYLVGDAYPDETMVYDQVNKKLSADIKATVTIKNIPWTDYLTKYQLIWASGEYFDLAYAGDFCQYGVLANKNAFLELTQEDIQTYAPKTWADMDANQLKGAEVNGKIYMVPAPAQTVVGSVVGVRGDLMKKYNVPDITDINGYYTYLETIAKNEKGITAFTNDPANTSWYDETYKRYNGFVYVDVYGNDVNLFDASPKVYNSFATDTFLQYALKMRELNQAGVFPKDLLSSKNLCEDMFKVGTVAADMGVYNSLFTDAVNINKEHADWEVKVFDITNYNTSLAPSSPSDAGMVLNPQTKYKARALMMIDLFREDQAYNDLTLAGIEGTHYTLTDKGQYTETDQGTKSYPYNSACPWGWVNNKLLRVSSTTPQAQIDARAKWATVEKPSPVVSFKFDSTSVKTQEAAVNNTLAKYMNVLVFGFAEDPKAELDKMNAELNADGLPQINAETQKQLDAYLAQFK